MKRFSLYLMVGALVAFSAAAGQAGLVSLYTFDDTTDAATLGINAVDSAYNGTAVNNVGTTAGAVGSAVTFTGGTTAATVAYIDMPALALPAAFRNSAQGSVSYWGKGNLSSGDYQLVAVTGGQMMHIATGAGSFVLYASASGNPTSGIIPLRTPANTTWTDTAGADWHLVTTTWNYDPATSKGRANVYIDSTKYPMTTTYATNSWKSNTTWGSAQGTGTEHRINGDVPGNGNGNGAMKNGQGMDDVGMWSNELGDVQVAAINNLARDVLDYNAQAADALFNLYAGPEGGTAVVGGQTWTKYGSGTAYDGTGAVTGSSNLALGANSGVQIVPEPGTLALLLAAAMGLMVFAWRRRK